MLNYAISSSVPIFMDRYLLFTLVGLIILVSFFLSKLPIRNSYYYVLVAAIGIYSLFQISMEEGPAKKMDYKSAANHVKIEKDSSTLVLIQTIDVTSLFTYYYDRELFKDYYNLEKNLMEKAIYTCNDSSKIKRFDESMYTKIIHVQTYAEFTDPNKTVEAWFNKRNYTLIKETKYVGVTISTYKNMTITANPTARLQRKKLFQDALIQDKINYMKTDAGWMKDLRKKAEDLKIPLDSVLRMDAKFVLNIKD